MIKNSFIAFTLTLCGALTVVASPYYSSYDTNNVSIAVDPSAPGFAPVENVKTSNDRAVDVATKARQSKGGFQFKSPVIFAETGYRYSEDSQAFGFNMDESRTDIGFDVDILDGWIVGLMYTFNYQSGVSTETIFGNTTLRSVNDYVANSLTTYTAKKFGDWFLTGLSFSYIWIDQKLQNTTTTPGFAGTVSSTDLDRDSIGLSPFVGVSHGWGKWNLAGTVAYSYAAEYFDAQPYRPGFTIENHNLLTTVRASYAIDEKWTLGGKVANTWLMHREDLPGLMFGGGPGARFKGSTAMTITPRWACR
ncbi:hypothetical protein QPK87_23315 [Kamptonema cortianum]|nr:hypothetical protein [Oscillatoria laete-virens]MDK3159482.1 hypothetical protein [Kamptonema cortianum]MDL5053023.1 hypothetical protein [Oscillatoria laete-virens NRMC-F 0139]